MFLYGLPVVGTLGLPGNVNQTFLLHNRNMAPPQNEMKCLPGVRQKAFQFLFVCLTNQGEAGPEGAAGLPGIPGEDGAVGPKVSPPNPHPVSRVRENRLKLWKLKALETDMASSVWLSKAVNYK